MDDFVFDTNSKTLKPPKTFGWKRPSIVVWVCRSSSELGASGFWITTGALSHWLGQKAVTADAVPNHWAEI
jgi:hypothetical protein